MKKLIKSIMIPVLSIGAGLLIRATYNGVINAADGYDSFAILLCSSVLIVIIISVVTTLLFKG